MSCGFLRAFSRRNPVANTPLQSGPRPTCDDPPPYSEAPPLVQKQVTRESTISRQLTREDTTRQILRRLYAQREELLDTIEDEPFTVHQAKLDFQAAVSNYGRAGWGEEGRREYNRAERKYQMIEAKHSQHQRKLKEIERDIHQARARRR